MTLKLLLPLLAGLSIVIQGTLNKTSANQLGIATALLLNSLILLIIAIGFWLLMKYSVLSGWGNTASLSFSELKWWQYLPGILGFVIILTTPLAIQHLGANLTFALIICTQLIISLLWDSLAQKSWPSFSSWMGIAIMMVGVLVLLSGKRG